MLSTSVHFLTHYITHPYCHKLFLLSETQILLPFFDSYLMEIKIILTRHLAHKNMPDIPQDFTLI